jgi:hypothetical protein
MMVRYVVRPAAWTVETDYPVMERPNITVYEPVDDPIDTGILNASGQKLYRIVEREPIGFRPRRIES